MIIDIPLLGEKITEKGVPNDQFHALLESLTLSINELRAPDFTVATVPDAVKGIRRIIYVSDETGGATLAFSDGTNWRRVQDRNIIS